MVVPPRTARVDALDAVRAAWEAGGERWAQPRACGVREAVRALLGCRDSAQTARTAAINELKALIVTSDPGLREQLRHLSVARLLTAVAALDPAGHDVELVGTIRAMRSLAGRISGLRAEVRELDRELTALIELHAPQLLAEHGVGVVTAAQVLVSWSHPRRCRSDAAFARLGGVTPIPATSGQVQTLREAVAEIAPSNRALHTVIVTRCRHHDDTRVILPAVSPKARPHAMLDAASSDISPAASTGPSRTHRLTTHRDFRPRICAVRRSSGGVRQRGTRRGRDRRERRARRRGHAGRAE